jgi:hypothetical protein
LNDDEIRAELSQLGIAAEHYRVVALLPLVQVAWADGRIQTAERDLILQIADRSSQLDPAARSLLQKWLDERPSEFYLSRGKKLLAVLAARAHFKDVSVDTLEEVVAYCQGVASAAGGLFGFFGNKVDDAEQRAIEDIARALHVEGKASWETLRPKFA